MSRCLIFYSFFISLAYVQAASFFIGPGQDYASPNALYQANVVTDGDTINIAAADYAGTAALAVWQADNLLIRGIGGRPHLIADGEYIWGKGIWVLAGNDITVENVEFSGAAVPDLNGAGIRLDGVGMTIRHCYFHDNENGILTNNSAIGDVLIEHSEFARNGQGDGQSHNLYIGRVGSLIFRYNYSHHARVGHALKSRASVNYITYNRIMDEETGFSSRLIDLSNGGYTLIMGNLFMQGPEAINNNLIGYGKEALTNSGIHQLFVVNNTLVNKRAASCLFLDINSGAEGVTVANNIFAGPGELVNGPVNEETGNLFITETDSLHFVDEAGFDYRLTSSSPAIDQGTLLAPMSSLNLLPLQEYIHPVDFMERNLVNGLPDVGAYELQPPNGVNDAVLTRELLLYPNPANDHVQLSISGASLTDLTLYNSAGQKMEAVMINNTLEISQLPGGMYYLVGSDQAGDLYRGSLLVK